MKLGLLREGKAPPDKRVPLTPAQCKALSDQYQDLELVVQPSAIRTFKNEAYLALGISLQEDLSDCDVLLGVKEVPEKDLLPGKTYLFFSHTIKKQPYNRNLLLRMLKLNIRMVDYEVITNANGIRLVGFGRYAGIVGCYNGFRAYGLKSKRFELNPAHQCKDRNELESEMKKISLPDNFKAVLTGSGRAGEGAREIMEAIGLKKTSPEAYRNQTFTEPAYTQLNVEDYYERNDRQPFTRFDFFKDSVGFHSTFGRYATVSDMYVACHYWQSPAPFIFIREDVRSADWKVQVVADVSCDINGPIASTLRPSTIDDPLYGYDPQTGLETDFYHPHSIGVMAVDNLPCELPGDASEDFGSDLIKNVIPALLGEDINGVIKRATICANGKLTPNFGYLKDYVNGEKVG